jgi:hypothetical protein
MECGVETAMDDLDLRPRGVLAPAIELAPAVGADRHDEARAPDLLAEAEGLRRVEFFGP